MTRPSVFISYSEQDETLKNQLIVHLGVLQQQGYIQAWTADRIAPGVDWAVEIDQAIERARVVVLLITANFLGSEFIQNQVERLRERQTQEGLIVFPIIAQSCAWKTVPWLARMKVRPKHEKPVWREDGRYVDEELSLVAEEIAGIVTEPQTQSPKIVGVERMNESAAAEIRSQFILPLQEALSGRSLTLFIGADLPQAITGLPSRTDLARELAHRKGLDESLSLAEVAQRVSQAGNRWEFTNFIRNALDTTGKTPQPFHQQVAALVKQHQIETIITTAYDNLLELALQQVGVGFNRVVRGSDVNFINSGRPTLIKLYGDAQQPDTLVVTDQDHSNLLRDREKEAVIDEVRRAFRRNTVLFLGYNLADPDFRFLFDQVVESRFARIAYAVWSGLPEVDVRTWRDRGIVILEEDPFGGESGDVGRPMGRPDRTIAVPVASTVGDKTSDLGPGEQQVDFAIITALPKEAQAIVSRLEKPEVRRFEDKDIRTYHYGAIPIRNTDQEYRVVVVLLPGMGNVSAANAVTDTITHWQPRFVLMVGIAGGIPQDDLDLGDVVVADQIVGYEYGKITEKGIKPRDRVYPASALLLDRIHNFWDTGWAQQVNVPRPENAARLVSKLFVGPIASGNKVVASTKFRQQLIKHWPKLVGLEMEGEGVFAAAFDRPQIPATLVIRGICDMADERKSDDWQEYAANAAAAFAISFIKSGPVDPQQ